MKQTLAAGHEPARHPGALAAAVALTLAAAAAHAAGPAETTANDLDEVIVTGSLIRDPNRDSPSPIVTTDAVELQRAGTPSIEAVLNQMPQFAAAGTAGNGGQGTGAHATLSLRGLGANRNLVLLDGRRLPLADINGVVDINFIPQSILSGVQTITGGASAVYGSDAMSGVVNFISLKKFDGLSADVQYGASDRGDFGQTNAALSMGSAVANGRGHALVSLGYTKREAVYGRDRPFYEFVTPSSFIGQGTFVPAATNLPNQAAVTALFARYGVTGTVSNALNLGFNDDGTLFTQTGARNYKGPTTGGYAVIGGNVRMPVGPQTVIMNPLNRKSVFTKFDFDLSERVNLYAQAFYVDSTAYTSSGGSLTQFGALTTIPVTNPFIPADLRTLLAARPNATASFTWNGRYVGIPAKAWDESYKVYQVVGGLKGDLGLGDWTWDVYASYDRTDHNQQNYNAVLKSQVQNLLNAADGGASICAGGFNPFGIANSTRISAACRDYMTTTAKSNEALDQKVYQGVVQGSLFRLPAGPVTAAVLLGKRSYGYAFSPDFNLTIANIEAVAPTRPTHGEIAVKEAAVQLNVPILSGAPFADSLEVGAAFRRSDYDTTGGVSSYEGDIRWKPVQSLLLRGGYQRAVRAPNIGELFSATSTTQVAFGTPPAAIGDPCDVRSAARTGANGAQVRALCLAQGIPASVIDVYTFPTTATAGIVQGNPNLQPETAKTFNLGASWQSSSDSSWLGGLTASVDFYDIKIDEVISVVPGLSTLSKCYNLDGSNPTFSAANSFCQLLVRDSNGLLQQINTPYLNLGGLRTSGVDLQIGWSVPLGNFGFAKGDGKAFVNTAMTRLQKYEVQTLPNSPFQDFTNTNTIANAATTSGSFPRVKALTSVGVDVGGAVVALRWRYTGAMDDVSRVTTPTNQAVGTKAYSLFDLTGTYSFGERWQLRAGVLNVADKGPVLVASSQTSTDPAVFDVVGRQYYLGMKYTY